MAIPPDEFERFLFFEQAREAAVAEYKRNPKDVENLVKLGQTLVELAQFVQGKEAAEMIDDAISKLEEAKGINPRRHETLWWLGNAYTTQGFQSPEITKANGFFEKAAACFKDALDIDPANDAYRKSLEVALKGPEIHAEIQQRFALQQSLEQPPGQQAAAGAKKSTLSDLYYDIAGWVILAVGVTVWLGLVSSRVPPPPAVPK